MKYYSTHRPIGPGTIPKKGVIRVCNFDDKLYVPEIKREAWGYVEYDDPLTEKDVRCYELTPEGTGNETFPNVERYMEKHGFLPADRSKVRKLLRDEDAVSAAITKDEIMWKDKSGAIGKTGRGNIGIQDNYA